MRDRLIELLEKADETVIGFSIEGDMGVLADHLLAEGVIVPPCKVGQTVYAIELLNHKEIYECRVNEICMSAGNNNFVVLDRFIGGFICSGIVRNIQSFGKTVFLSREEAEEALERRAK